MKAITLKENGGTENLVLAEIPRPVITAGEVLIKVRAISINPVDAFVRQSVQGMQMFLKPAPDDKIIIPGWDVAGTVVEVGSGVTDLRSGDHVFGLINFAGHGRAYAEYVAAPANQLALKPDTISFEEAAAATLAALTAWQALVTHAKVKKGEKVIVYAAAGGVGHYAVQIAKKLGATVIAVTSSAHHQFVRSLGADVILDHTTQRIDDVVKDADVVLDAIAGDHILRSMDSLRPGGRLISLLAFIEGDAALKVKEKQIDAKRMTVVSNGDDMKQLARLLGEKAIRSHVSSVFPFTDLASAHKQIETRKTQGKIVVTL
jgi:NADPH:quinone reductase-like Zn-dependent oxidoreductase